MLCNQVYGINEIFEKKSTSTKLLEKKNKFHQLLTEKHQAFKLSYIYT